MIDRVPGVEGFIAGLRGPGDYNPRRLRPVHARPHSMNAEECLHGVWLGGWCSDCAAMMWDAFALRGAAASVGIEHGMTTDEVLELINDKGTVTKGDVR